MIDWADAAANVTCCAGPMCCERKIEAALREAYAGGQLSERADILEELRRAAAAEPTLGPTSARWLVGWLERLLPDTLTPSEVKK